MKLLRIAISVALLGLSTLASAQSDATKSFDQLKSLAGSWEGKLTTIPQEPSVEGKVVNVSLRVTSMGNALMHEMRVDGRKDDPITMLYLDGDRLMLTHYCDAGNRPRMTAKASADGKSVQFELLDVAGNMQYGHMHQAVFTVIDPDHHSEDWTFMEKDTPVRVHLDLQRSKTAKLLQ